jgi:phosphotriesterase-related protein
MQIMTVLGPIRPEQLGPTMPHDHLLCDVTRPYWTPADRNRMGSDFYFEDELVVLEDEAVAIDELGHFTRAGGSGIVELTLPCLRRNPAGLKRIATASGVHVVMGCGFYFEKHYEPRIYTSSVNELAGEIEGEIVTGVGDTGIRPGIIGEIGSNRDFVSPAEERVFRAVARAQKRTGIAITTHAVHGRIGLSQLDLLMEEGVDPHRVAIGHSDLHLKIEYHEAIVSRGAFVQYDLINNLTVPSQPKRAALVAELIKRGYVEQILLSQDTCLRAHLRTYGGGGYGYLLTNFLPMLRDAGVSDEQIHQITVENPRRLLAF